MIGHGASGRNGGFVMPLLGWNLAYTARKLGRERTTAAYRAMYAAIDACLAMVRDDGIDCDLEETGYLLLSCSAARRRHVEEEAALGCELGFGYELLEGDALREHVKSRAFLTGCWDPHTAILNPAKLARGMKRSVERLGARVYEQTQLLELSGGDPVVLRTPRATVRARTAVLAVNGYGAALGLMPSRVLPVHTFIVLTEPVSRESLEEIGWAERRTSLETSRNFIHYFRLTSDDRILFGGEDATLYWGSRHLDEDARVFARLEARFREYFPELARVRISHRWGGVLGVTLDMFPTFGAEGNVLFGGGYSGHGVSLGASAGRILAPEILARLGRDGGSSAAAAPLPFGRRPPPLPPDPSASPACRPTAGRCMRTTAGRRRDARRAGPWLASAPPRARTCGARLAVRCHGHEAPRRSRQLRAAARMTRRSSLASSSSSGTVARWRDSPRAARTIASAGASASSATNASTAGRCWLHARTKTCVAIEGRASTRSVSA
ncbi:MAG: FAD-binding oxidoreductase [Sandaracinaceae bacterium]|nr:FAD-binding oxidoreductase [Sandaracinaceae bacterium]